MLIPSHDAPLSDAEWRSFVLEQPFGQLIAPGRAREIPAVAPAPYLFDGVGTIELHLRRDNPVWEALEENDTALFVIAGDYAYVPSYWNAPVGTRPEWAPPTSYYAAVHLVTKAKILDRAEEIAHLLMRHMAAVQPEGGHAGVEPGESPFGRMLGAIRGLRLEVREVRAKFKYGGNRTPQDRARIAGLLASRGRPGDLQALRHVERRARGGRP